MPASKAVEVGQANGNHDFLIRKLPPRSQPMVKTPGGNVHARQISAEGSRHVATPEGALRNPYYPSVHYPHYPSF